MREWVFAAVLVMVTALPMQADTAAMPAAIGRISYGTDNPAPGAAICTGTLVAPDLVLTARHCIEKAWATPWTVRFEANAALGQSLASGRGAEVILSSAAVTRDRANDVALLRLSEPIPVVAPMRLADPAMIAATVAFSLFAYNRAAPDLPQDRQDCQRRGDGPGVLALSCAVVSGNSGAAVLIWDGAGWQIAAVMVASVGGGPAQALAASIPADIADLIPQP